jgi:general secretion pathway protein I
MREARGFTLLEVLIALVIAGMALGVMFAVASGSLHGSQVSARYEDAVVRARSHMAMAANGGSLAAGNWSGDDGGGYQWHLRVTQIATGVTQQNDGSAVPLALFGISVWITWGEGDNAREVRLDTEQIGQPLASG